MKKSSRPKGTGKPGRRRGPLALSRRLQTRNQRIVREEKILRRVEEKEAARLMEHVLALRASRARNQKTLE